MINDLKHQLADAYTELAKQRTAMYEAEEIRIEAAIKREEKFLEAINEAQADGITDPGRQQQKAQKATRAELTDLHQSEKAARKATHEYQLAGIRVDGLVKLLEVEKLAMQNDGQNKMRGPTYTTNDANLLPDEARYNTTTKTYSDLGGQWLAGI